MREIGPRTFVLGAGFSKYAGLPLGSELWSLVLSAARESEYYGILYPALDWFVTFKRRTEVVELSFEEVDLEELISLLDINHFLRLEGTHNWCDEGDMSQLLLKNLIARILLDYQERVSESQMRPYVDFASRLGPRDLVLSFNYDTLLEDSLDLAGVPFRLAPHRFEDVDEHNAGILDSEDTDVIVLKVHGSIDWFDSGYWRGGKGSPDDLGSPPFERHPVFSRPEVFEPTPITPEPYVECALRSVYRVKNLREYFGKALLTTQAPLVLAPSRHKLLYSNPLRKFWWGMNTAGTLNKSVGVVGFSLPPHDQYALQALYAMLVNFQEEEPTGFFDKSPVRFVDRFVTEEARTSYQRRFSFVDWTMAETDGEGFRPEAVDFLFNE